MGLLRKILMVLSVFFSSMGYSAEMQKIYISSGYWGNLFDLLLNRDDSPKPMWDFLLAAANKGYRIEQAETLDNLSNFKYLIVFEVFPDQIEKLKQYPKEKLILFLWEPPSVLPNNYDRRYHAMFSRIYTWHDGLVDNIKYFKLQYPVKQMMVSNSTSFEKKRMFTLIARNKSSDHADELYSERSKLIEFFEFSDKVHFDLYGKGWPKAYRTFRGPIEIKVDVLKDYRFCFAYENVKNIPGYITEKIFDCFHAGCIPVYWGAPNINSYIPKNCYISREDFGSDQEMVEFLQGMNEAEYCSYLSNIKKYLESSQSYPFSSDAFVERMVDLIQLNIKPIQ